MGGNFAQTLHSFDNSSHCVAIKTLPLKSFNSEDEANGFLKELNAAHEAAVEERTRPLVEAVEAVIRWKKSGLTGVEEKVWGDLERELEALK